MVSLRNFESFGEIAAEDEPVLEYFLSTNAVDEVLSGDKLLVLGRKGSGKTALVKHFTEGNSAEHGSPLSLRNYPWNAHAELIDKGASDSEAYVASWKLLIAIRLASHIVRRDNHSFYSDSLSALEKFLKNNFGGTDPDTREIVQQPKMQVEGLSISPQLAGVALGTINFRRNETQKVLGAELNALTSSILHDVSTAISELKIERLFLHFDELDQGLDQIDNQRAVMLIGLILAAREISRDQNLRANICPIVYLRTDIWEQISFSDKNKITRSAAITLQWDEETLRKLVDVRLSSKLGLDATWDVITDEGKMRGGQSKFNHILARTLMRPRDVIQFLNVSLKQAKRRNDEPLIMTNDDINGARPEYSEYLKEELDDEIRPHWENWDDALAVCSKTETITFFRSDFVKNYGEMKLDVNGVDANTALELLYRFSIVGYETRRGRGGSGWAFRYLDSNVKWDSSVEKLKVHQGLKEFAKLREERA